ncbi:MAG: hypothetical protein IJB58_04495 [Bacteroidales bacterium]|nr:hypothetical protein [Bacteroidales bacterium]
MCFKKKVTDSAEKITINPLTPEVITDKGSQSYKTVKEISAAINHDDIKNIAVTGPYGSGKSSILKTLTEDFNKDRKYLSISLATLKSGLEDQDARNEGNATETDNSITKVPSKENEELNRKIEYSIVQQLIYRESTYDLPNSRIKKIVHTKPWGLLWKPLVWIIFILALWKLFNPEWLEIESITKTIPITRERIIDSICLLYVFIVLFFTIRGLIKSYSNSKLNKLNLKDGEIEIKENNSIFNKHLDEIIYFFQATKYNVVIIEDLDRYETTDIFLKLRELNLIINNAYSTIKRKITFIYAIRDDMFKDTDRTKFFDYITTVIPVINYSNSKEKLTKALRAKGYKVEKDGDFEIEDIEDIAFFIDDMRLLKNIVNEFDQYWKKLGSNGKSHQLKPSKLLAMITYKNFYPEEFVKLHRREGRVYTCLSNKPKYIEFALKTIEDKIALFDKEEDALKQTRHLNIEELRSVYAEKVRTRIRENCSGNIYLSDNKPHNLEDVLKNLELFLRLWNDDYFYLNDPRYYPSSKISLNRKEIERQINSKHSFLERLKALQDSASGLRKKKREVEIAKSKIRSLTISELCSSYSVQRNNEYKNAKLKELEDVFIQNGYIGEDYYDYISYFYDDIISRDDHDFILATKIDKSVGYDYHLDKPKDVVTNMRLPLFRNQAAINFDIIDYLITDRDNEEKLKILIETIKDSQTENDFLEEYYNNTANPLLFFAKLYGEHKDWLWSHCINRANSGNQSLMVAYFMVCDKATMSTDEIQWLNDHFDLIEALHGQMGISDFNGLIKDCRFVKINNKRADLLDYIISNKLYQINTDNLVVIANHLGHAPVSKEELTLTRMLGLNNLGVSDYILGNLGICITQFSDKAKNESTESLLIILNDTSIDEAQKRKYLSQQENAISNLSDIETEEMTNLSMNLNILSGSWDNVIDYYDSYKWNDTLATYINKRAPEIGETEISVTENANLINHILTNIPASSLRHLSGSLKAYDFNTLENIEEFDADNIERLLDSNFNIAQIRTIINRCKRNVILESPKIGMVVVREYLKELWDLDVEKLITASNSISDIETKLKLFASILRRTDIEDSIVTLLINLLPEEYHQLNDKGKRVKLEAAEHNIMLADVLKARDYISSYILKGDRIQLNTKKS